MDKDTFRKEIKKRIEALDSDYIKISDRDILVKTTELPEFSAARRVFTYLSIGREVDTKSLIEYCRKAGKQVALPTDYNSGEMTFAQLDCPLSDLRAGKFNIPVPGKDSVKLRPESGDIIIVPALCYDENRYRLGHGGGYYDRYLSTCPAFSVGLCREKLVVPAVPREDFDLSVGCLVTEKRIARPK